VRAADYYAALLSRGWRIVLEDLTVAAEILADANASAAPSFWHHEVSEATRAR